MKKIYLTLIAVLLAFQFTYAQWATSGNNIYNTNTGFVGIGTGTNPLGAQLTVQGRACWALPIKHGLLTV